MLRRTILPLLVAALFQTACATLSSPGEQAGRLKDSVLTNSNPAPAALTPPNYDDAKSPMVDPVNMSSQADYHFTLGESLSFEGQFEKAIEEFKLTLVYDPSAISVRLRLAAEYVRAGQISEAVEQAEIVVQANPSNDESRMFLGGLYTGMKMYDAAMTQFRSVLEHNPTHSEAAIYLGAILAEQKEYDEALKHFNSLLENKDFADKDKVHFYIGKIQVERGSEHYAAAEQSFLKAIALKPENSEVVLALGMLYKLEGHDEKMVRLWKNWEAKNGPDRSIAHALGHYLLEKERFDEAIEQLEALEGYEKDNLNVKIQIALILIEQKKFEKASHELEDILDQAPELDKVRYYLAAVYEELKRTDDAVAQYLKLPVASSYYVDALIHAAHLLKEDGKADKAVDLVKEATTKRDDSPQLYAYYAALLDDQKRYKEALAMLTDAVEKFPTHAQLRFYLGSMYDRMGDTDQTITQMKKVLDLDHDNVQALNYLAYTYAEQGKDLSDAEDLARRALEKQPNDGYILDTVGWVLFKQGKMEESIKFLEHAFHEKSDEAVIAEHLGDAYLRYELWQKALHMYRKAAELETDTEKSRRIREKLAGAESQKQRPLRSPASTPAH